MPDIAEVLARPEVIRFVEDLIFQAAKTAGVADTHAERIALGVKSRLEAGEKIDQLVAIGQAFRSAALNEAAAVVDEAREWAEGDLRGPRDRLRMMARNPDWKPDPEDS